MKYVKHAFTTASLSLSYHALHVVHVSHGGCSCNFAACMVAFRLLCSRCSRCSRGHCHGPAILRASHVSAHCEWSRLGWSSRFGLPHPFGLSHGVHGAAQALLHRLLPALLRCPSASILSRQPAPAQDLELREHAQHEQRQVPLLIPATDAAAAATCSTRRTCCSGAARWAPSGKCWAGDWEGHV